MHENVHNFDIGSRHIFLNSFVWIWCIWKITVIWTYVNSTIIMLMSYKINSSTSYVCYPLSKLLLFLCTYMCSYMWRVVVSPLSLESVCSRELPHTLMQGGPPQALYRRQWWRATTIQIYTYSSLRARFVHGYDACRPVVCPMYQYPLLV